MGNFYVNYTLRGPHQHAVAAVLAGRASIVSPPQNGCVVVFDEESEEQNQEVIAELASKLSGRLKCPLLAVLNHDDDILNYQLFLNGDLMDEYDSTPGYFGGEEDEDDEFASVKEPEGGNAKLLCETFGVNGVSEVERILRRPSGSEDGYVFAYERHADLADALGIALLAVGTSFSALVDGELPEDLDEEGLVRTKDMVVASEDSKTKENGTSAPRAGYYKVSFRAVPGLKKSIPVGWMPGLWAELDCGERGLSKDFWNDTVAYREQSRLWALRNKASKSSIGFSIRIRATEGASIISTAPAVTSANCSTTKHSFRLKGRRERASWLHLRLCLRTKS